MKITFASMVTIPEALIEDVTFFFKNDRDIKVSMLRLDQLHPIVSGNKWFKLKYNLKAAIDNGFNRVITFGGAYSNHLIATAAAANAQGLRTIGIVRGFHAKEQLTPTLQACVDQNMQLHFVSREDYTAKETSDFLQTLIENFGPSFIIPEGGDNDLGRLGVGDIATLIPEDATHVCLPVGTGTTLTGIRSSLNIGHSIVGFTAMKDGDYLYKEMAEVITARQNENWWMETSYSFNGFAKTTPELVQFMRSFYTVTNIPLDIVYTGKMMFGVNDMINRSVFHAGSNIICIHTGGLQGNPADLFNA